MTGTKHTTYLSLPADATDEASSSVGYDEYDEGPPSLSVSRSDFSSRSSGWMVLGCVIAISIAGLNTLLLQLKLHQIKVPSTALRYPSVYVGLERLIRNESSPSWPLNFEHGPDFLGVVDQSVPHQPSSGEPQMILDSDRSLILQYIVRDFGLENCAISSRLPGPEVDASPKFYNKSGDIETMFLWSLETPVDSVLRSADLTWSSRPRRQTLIGSLNLTLDRDFSPFFPCPRRSVQTIELSLACGSPGCTMEFWQDRSPPKLGFYIIQSEV
ncbi:hypothetical protein BV22DRAFT_1130984 [Leucogyrophana mollusca]|uniref:Uncharacterized protein n=1 Tax=Leucogyrophana mollusca TaxID=85980 RepID=A0ACB8BCD8_9AGAM|nr:hypothetical protein BV22DRAFT_1130984 [Leucogyrophana mollusca]